MTDFLFHKILRFKNTVSKREKDLFYTLAELDPNSATNEDDIMVLKSISGLIISYIAYSICCLFTCSMNLLAIVLLLHYFIP